MALCAAAAALVAAFSSGPAPSAGRCRRGDRERGRHRNRQHAAWNRRNGRNCGRRPGVERHPGLRHHPRLIVPDVIASVPGGVTKADLAWLRKLSGVRAVLAIDGAKITVNGLPRPCSPPPSRRCARGRRPRPRATRGCGRTSRPAM